MNAITLLRQDHRTVEKLFVDFEKAGDRAYKSKRDIVDALIRELSIHAAIEEEVFYPAARRAASATTGLVLESIEEHHVVKWLLHELEKLDAQDETFDAKVAVLTESVRRHVEEEEGDLFPHVEKGLSEERLEELGSELQKAKASAPTRPHPRGSAVPSPADLMVDTVTGIGERARDVVNRVR